MSDFWLLAGVVLLVLELRSAPLPGFQALHRRKTAATASLATG